jgi:hypothetical protein
MKFTLKTVILTLFLTTSIISCNTKQNEFYHIMMIEYKQNANMNEISAEVLGFKDIPSVLDFSFGEIEKNSKNKIQNFKYCLLLKFKDKESMDAYLIHPYHQEIYKKHKPFIADIYTVDFMPISLNK